MTLVIKKKFYIFIKNNKTKGLEYYKKIENNICVVVRIIPGEVLKIRSW